MKLQININDLTSEIVSKNIKVRYYVDEVNPVPQVDYFEGIIFINKESVYEYKKEIEEDMGLYFSEVDIYGKYETKDQDGIDIVAKVLAEDIFNINIRNSDTIAVDVIDVD